MAIPIDDYRNTSVGTALLLSIDAMQRVQKLARSRATLAELEHAVATAELTIGHARESVRRARVCAERREEALEWLRDYEARVRACRPAVSTH